MQLYTKNSLFPISVSKAVNDVCTWGLNLKLPIGPISMFHAKVNNISVSEHFMLSVAWKKNNSNIGGYVLHVLPLESFRGIIVHNSWLVMSTLSHSSVWLMKINHFAETRLE